ncbi:MAG TPA: hypothetical protein VF707_14570 [Ardenticatenaceae bacterium]
MSTANPVSRVLPAVGQGTSGNSNPSQRRSLSIDLRNTATFFLGCALLGILFLLIQTKFSWSAATPLLWAFACLASGGAVGFLFGIPKILQGGGPANNGANGTSADTATFYRQQVNTNLEEISDWLTKIIVGLGLVQLGNIPSALSAVASQLAGSMSTPPNNQAFALALIVYFLVVGFLFGYLSTRLFLAGAFSRADRDATALLAIGARLDSVEKNQDALTTTLVPTPALTSGQGDGTATEPTSVLETLDLQAETPPASTPLETLQQMADAYLTINAPDSGERVRQKDEAAARMANLIIQQGISKDQIAQMAVAQHSEGLAVALASAIHFHPETGDFALLMQIAPWIQKLHVQYTIVLTLGKLFRLNIATAANRTSALALLSTYEQTADQPLQQQIAQVRALINQATGGTPPS